MFDIGFSELVIVALVGLVVLGPKRLPEVARTVGQWVAKVRRFVADVKDDLDREMQHADLSELRNLKHELDETRKVVQETSTNLIRQANVAAPAEAADAGAVAGLEEPAPPAPRRPSRRKKAAVKQKKKRRVSKGAHGRSR